MTINEAKRLKRGDRIRIRVGMIYSGQKDVLGTVTSNTHRALSGNGDEGELYFVPYDEHETASVLRIYSKVQQ